MIGSMRTLRSRFCLFAKDNTLGEAIDSAPDWFDHYGGLIISFSQATNLP